LAWSKITKTCNTKHTAKTEEIEKETGAGGIVRA
jgi:hypothetical protein